MDLWIYRSADTAYIICIQLVHSSYSLASYCPAMLFDIYYTATLYYLHNENTIHLLTVA